MPDKEISALPVATALTGIETFPVVQGGITVQVPISYVADYIQPTLADILANDNKTGGFDITSDDGNSVASIINGEILLYSGTTSNAGKFYLSEGEASINASVGGFYVSEGVVLTSNYFQVKTTGNLIKHSSKNLFSAPQHEFDGGSVYMSNGGAAEFLFNPTVGLERIRYSAGVNAMVDVTNSLTYISNGNSIELDSPVINYGVAASQHFFLGTDLKYNGLNVATENYVDNLISGLKFKQDVVVASTANVNVSAAPTSIDSVTLTVGDRVLLKDQTNATQNGVYVFMGFGQALVRATDSNAGDELVSATYPVRSGTVNQDTWYTITNDAVTIGTSNITFTQTAGAGTYTVGSYLKLTGNVFDIDFTTFSTTQITEGTNLYFTDARARTAVIASSITDGDTTHSPSGDVVFDAMALKVDVEVASTTGVALTFTKDQVYGSIATPETGNITYSATGAKLGVTNIIIHNHTAAPTFGTNMKKLSGSGDYVVSVVNYIYVTYINSTEVIYSINQRT